VQTVCRLDNCLFGGARAEVWIQPGCEATQGMSSLRVRHDVSCACKCYGMSLHIALVVHSLLTTEIATRKWFCMQAGYTGKGP
jgi:hypothetical protein